MGLRSWLFGEKPAAVPPPTDTLSAAASEYYPQWLGPQYALASPDDLIGRQGMAIYREMQADAAVFSALRLLRDAVLSSPLEITAEGDDDLAEEAADFARESFEYLDGQTCREVLDEMLDGLAMGFSCVEKVWREAYPAGHPWAGKIAYRRFVPLPQETVTFKVDRAGEIEPDGIWQSDPSRHYIAASTSPAHYVKLPRDRFAIWAWQKRWNNPLGYSILRAAYAPWEAKKQGRLWWGRYLELHGIPIVAVESNEQDTTSLIRKVKMGLLSKVIATKPGTKITFEAPSGAAANANFQAFLDYQDGQIKSALLNPSLLMSTSDSGPAGSSGAQQDAFLWFVDSIRTSLAAAVRDQIVRPLIEMNYGDAVDVPCVKFAETDANRLDVILSRAERAQKMGLEFSSTWLRRVAGIPEPEEGEEVLHQAGALPTDAPPPDMEDPAVEEMDQLLNRKKEALT